MDMLINYVQKCITFKKDQDAEAKSARAEELNNFESVLLENFQPEDGKIESCKRKKCSGKHRKGVYKSKTHAYKTLDNSINKYYFSFNAYLKGQSKKTNKKLLKSGSA